MPFISSNIRTRKRVSQPSLNRLSGMSCGMMQQVSSNPSQRAGAGVLTNLGKWRSRMTGAVHIKEAGYLTELKCYNGPEFWKEIDRVPMSINIPTGGNVPVQMTNSNSSHYNGWWSHGYTVRSGSGPARACTCHSSRKKSVIS